MTTTEVVLYQIKSEKLSDYSKISKIVDQFLNNREGFISRNVKQDHEDETLFLDIVEWENLEDAQSAAEELKTESSMMPFFEAMEKVINFNHFHTY